MLQERLVKGPKNYTNLQIKKHEKLAHSDQQESCVYNTGAKAAICCSKSDVTAFALKSCTIENNLLLMLGFK
jgi:hypothetical protein